MSVETIKRTKPAKAARGSRKPLVNRRNTVALIDVFAGCGGFSEGFVSYRKGQHSFDLALAIDSDIAAHNTHLLRTFYHQFKDVPDDYYAVLRQSMTVDQLYTSYEEQASSAQKKVLHHELGKDRKADEEVLAAIPEKISACKDWVLIGGPPCQAYSVAGRARNKGIDGYQSEEDHRHFLYREYLKIIASHWPTVFVMENVPGILSAKVGKNTDPMWHQILEDLTDPPGALGMTEYAGEYDGYRLYSLVTPWKGTDLFGKPNLKPEDYVVKCERYGVPQARHRVFIMGVRSDITVEPSQLVPHDSSVTCGSVLDDLPPLRSGLSKIEDSDNNWLALMRDLLDAGWWDQVHDDKQTYSQARQAIDKLSPPANGRGGQYVTWPGAAAAQVPSHLHEWYVDTKMTGVCNHMSKAHMESDVHRYVFAASHSKAGNDKLQLKHFPDALLPDHENVKSKKSDKKGEDDFVDRFSVVKPDIPARTIVSHIRKDGHYYIHPDARQARSLTVREAARVQTFPDNFYFPGSRTDQYRQVGNAVPPYLARQIAALVDDVLSRAGR